MLPFIHLTLAQLIETAGYAGIFGMVFCESGLPFGFIFPGDSLLFTAGFLASQHILSLLPLIAVTTSGAVLGDSAGYWLGASLGPRIFTREDSFFFNKGHVARTQAFYARYGTRAVIFARFIPTVRTFVPIFAGVGSMRYARFLSYNVIGAVAWGMGVPLLGYYLGAAFPQLSHYLTYIVFGIILVSLIPLAYEYVRYRAQKKTERA